MKKILQILFIPLVVLLAIPAMAEFSVYNDSDEFIGVLVDHYYKEDTTAGYDKQYWVLYNPKTGHYFKYEISNMGSGAQIATTDLYYATDVCSGTSYVPYDMFNTVYKMSGADIFYKGGQERIYLFFKSRWDGSTCHDISNNVMHFRQAIGVPSNEVPLTQTNALQWHLKYKRTSTVVIPLSN